MHFRSPGKKSVLILFLGLAAFSSAGCLNFEKQTIVLYFPKDGKEVRALLVYEGLHVWRANRKEKDAKQDAKDLQDAKEDLAELAQGGAFIFADRLLRIPLKLRPNEKPDPKGQEAINKLNLHLTIHPGLFLTGTDGKTTYCQPMTCREPQRLVAWINQTISEEMLRKKGIEKEPILDEATFKILKKAAQDGHAWIRLEPGRITFTMPGTVAFFERMKKEIKLDMARIHKDLEALNQQSPESKKILERLHKDFNELQAFLESLRDTPWSLEQRHNQLSVALGWGNSEPLRLNLPFQRKFEINAQDRELYGYAKTLGMPVRNDLGIEAVVEEFRKSGRLPGR